MSRNGRNKGAQRRSAARLLAVQALYELDLVNTPTDSVLREFIENRWRAASVDEDGADAVIAEPDGELLTSIVRGVTERLGDVDTMVGAALTGGWTVARLEAVLRAILRAGTFELVARSDVPPRVIINEYMEVAHAFFAGNEAGMVNGVLDRLAHTLRADEFERAGADDKAETTKEG
jgi:transcription antitermination protein NusB